MTNSCGSRRCCHRHYSIVVAAIVVAVTIVAAADAAEGDAAKGRC